MTQPPSTPDSHGSVGAAPWAACVFLFRLPFNLPFPRKRIYRFERYNFADTAPIAPTCPATVTLSFHQLRAPAPQYPRAGFDEGLRFFLGGDSTPASLPTTDDEFADTWVEAVTPHRRFVGERLDPPTTWLERCLEAVNQLVVAYRMTTRDPAVHHVTTVHLDPIVPLLHLDTRTGARRLQSLVLVHTNAPVPRKP